MDGAVPSSDAQPLTLPAANDSFSLRAKLKRFPALVRMKKAVRGALYGFDSEILGRFPLFQPWSAGRSEALEKLTVLAANQTFPLMAQLLTKIGKDNLALIRADDFCGRGESRETSTQLKQLLSLGYSSYSKTSNYS